MICFQSDLLFFFCFFLFILVLIFLASETLGLFFFYLKRLHRLMSFFSVRALNFYFYFCIFYGLWYHVIVIAQAQFREYGLVYIELRIVILFKKSILAIWNQAFWAYIPFSLCSKRWLIIQHFFLFISPINA